jgi:hypothetical protein
MQVSASAAADSYSAKFPRWEYVPRETVSIMKQVETFRWYLPNPNPRGKPYLSRWHMSAQDAAARGALRPEPTSRIVREVPDTDDERRAAQIADASRIGGHSPDKD